MPNSLLSIRLVIASACVGPAANRRAHPIVVDITLVVRYDAIDQTVALGCRRINGIAQQQQLEGAPKANDARQQIARAHIGSGQSDPGEQEGEARLLRGDAQIGRQRQHRARARSHPVEGGENRFIEHAHVLDDRAGHPSKVEMALQVALQQFADDLLYIAAREKASPAPVSITTFTASSYAAPRRGRAVGHISRMSAH